MNVDEIIVDKVGLYAVSLHILKTFLMVIGDVVGSIHFLPVIRPDHQVPCLG